MLISWRHSERYRRRLLRRLQHEELLVLQALIDRSTFPGMSKGYVRASHAWLSKMTGLTEYGVRRALDSLRSWGDIRPVDSPRLWGQPGSDYAYRLIDRDPRAQ